MQEINCIDETFDTYFSEVYHLSVQSDLNGFSYCVLDTRVNKFVLLRHIPYNNLAPELAIEKIEEHVASEELFNKPMKSALFVMRSPVCPLIPSDYYNVNKLKSLFELTHPLDELDELHAFELKHLNSYMVYAVPNRLAYALTKKNNKIRFMHECIPFMMHPNEESKQDNPQIWLLFSQQYFHIAISSLNQLLFINSYHFHSPTDVLYYVLSAANQAQVEPLNCKVLIKGDIHTEAITVQLLKSHFENVQFDKIKNDFSYSYTFNKYEQHLFSNLINSCRCV